MSTLRDQQGNPCAYNPWKDIGKCQGKCDGQATKKQQRTPKHPGQGCPQQTRKVPCVVGNPCHCTWDSLGVNEKRLAPCSGTTCFDASPGDTCVLGCTNQNDTLMGPHKFLCQRGVWTSNKYSTQAQDQPKPTCTKGAKTCPNLTGDSRYHISGSYYNPSTGSFETSVCVQARNGDKCHIYCRSGYSAKHTDPNAPGHGMLLKCKETSTGGTTRMFWDCDDGGGDTVSQEQHDPNTPVRRGPGFVEYPGNIVYPTDSSTTIPTSCKGLSQFSGETYTDKVIDSKCQCQQCDTRPGSSDLCCPHPNAPGS